MPIRNHKLADDASYWTGRLYLYAVEGGEQFEEADNDPEWTPLDELTRELHQPVP